MKQIRLKLNQIACKFSGEIIKNIIKKSKIIQYMNNSENDM